MITTDLSKGESNDRKLYKKTTREFNVWFY